MRLWGVEAPTFCKQSTHRWRLGCQPYVPAWNLLLQEDSWHSFLLGSESNQMISSRNEPATFRLVASTSYATKGTQTCMYTAIRPLYLTSALFFSKQRLQSVHLETALADSMWWSGELSVECSHHTGLYFQRCWMTTVLHSSARVGTCYVKHQEIGTLLQSLKLLRGTIRTARKGYEVSLLGSYQPITLRWLHIQPLVYMLDNVQITVVLWISHGQEFAESGKLSEVKKKTPWSESASELYRPSDRPLSAKWLPTFADRGCHVVSVTDPYGRILDFLDRSR
jgi:hypothetical protein